MKPRFKYHLGRWFVLNSLGGVMSSGVTPQEAWDSYALYEPPQPQYPFIKAEPGFFEKALGAIKKAVANGNPYQRQVRHHQ